MRAFTKSLLFASTALAAVHTVDVGEDGLKFDPQTLTAAKGDIVIFTFYPSHDVAQASFSDPCKPSSNGFYGGPFGQTDNGKKKFVYTVNSTDPIYYYCSVQKHCQSGMVGGINVPSDGDNIQKFADAAKSVSKSDTPQGVSGGQLLEDEQIASITATAGGSATPSASASASGSGSPSQSAASTTPAASGSGAPTGSGSASAASGTPSPTGAANAVGPASGVFAAVLGFAAWFL